MQRRKFLGMTGAAIGLAGCLGGGSAGLPTETEARPEEAASSLEDAQDHLETARETYQDTTSTMFQSGNEVDFDIEPIRASITNARADLDSAEASATDEQLELVASLRMYADYIDTVTDSIAAFSNALNHFYTAASYENASRYDDAADELESSLDDLETAEKYHGEAEKLAESLASESLDEGDVAWSKTTVAVNDLGKTYTAFRTLGEGGVKLDRGIAVTQQGLTTLQNENYANAKKLFMSAEDLFTEAYTIYKGGEASAPQSIKSTIISQTCNADTRREVANHLMKAAEHADNGNMQEANREIEDASEALKTSC